jgi:hypothetical protein
MSSNIQYVSSDTVGAGALNQFQMVKTPGACVVTAADTDIAYGVIQVSAAATTADVRIVTFGETKALASGAITKGARICPDSTGRVKAAVTGDLVCGYALEAAGANGDEISIFFIPTTSVVIA